MNIWIDSTDIWKVYDSLNTHKYCLDLLFNQMGEGVGQLEVEIFNPPSPMRVVLELYRVFPSLSKSNVGAVSFLSGSNFREVVYPQESTFF